jgi:hypothetical protein
MVRTIVLVALCLALPTATAAAGAVNARPALKLAKASPLTVQGTGFRASERVRVTVVATRAYVRTTHTTRAGRFTARFADVDAAFDRCGNGLLITARGALGDVARLKLPQPECPPSLGP